jgi:hypothetical protein
VIRLYHGSDVLVQTPDVRYAQANANADFGRGFYLTEHFDQAADWAVKKARKKMSKTHIPAVSVYICDADVLGLGQRVVHKFSGYSGEWFKFVVACRSGDSDRFRYGLVTGRVADDDVYDTVRLYENKAITFEEALRRLRQPDTTNHYVQWCFRNQNLLDRYIKFDAVETQRVNKSGEVRR